MAEAVKDYQKLEHDIIRLAGGADNIASAQRCATYLKAIRQNMTATSAYRPAIGILREADSCLERLAL